MTNPRLCPRCRLPFRPLVHAGVTLDVCVECKGLWFDGGEVQRAIGAETAGPFRGSLSGERSRSAGLSCPADHAPLREVTLDYDGHRADAAGCPTCGGVWMEPGDLARIRRHLPGSGVVSGGRIENLALRVDEARREADERRAAEMEDQVRSGGRHWLFQYFVGLPVEVYNPVRNRPLATYGLLAVNLLVFVFQIVSPDNLIGFGLVPAAFLSGLAPWTIITAMFLHGDLFHIFGNMYFLAVFGDNVEDRVGIAEYLALYVVGGIAASLAHVASHPGSTVPMVGASGAVSAVLGAYVYLFPQRKLYFMIFFFLRRIRAIWYLGIWLALQFVFAASGAPGVAWWAHIGGFAVGIGFAALYRASLRRRLRAMEAA